MENKKIKIGIIGCGTIGNQLAQAIEKRFSHQAELCAICDIDKDKANNLKGRLSVNPLILSVEELVARCDLIVEAASAKVASLVAQEAIQHSKDVMIMSVAGILDSHQQLFSLAKTKGCHIYLPSGAIGGLDAVKAAAMAKVNKAALVTRKPPQGLAGAPYIVEQKIDLSRIKTETVVFEGPATEAIKGFPKNVNVCAALSLAGIGAGETKVQIITSPDYKDNIHEVQVEGDFGKLIARTENVPSADNPKTSLLASLSAVATLKNILDVVKIGT
jgi:aspartate dehydrogenase